MVKSIKSSFEAERLLQTLLDALRGNLNPTYSLLYELIANAHDAGARQVQIIVNPSERIYKVQDNGHGFDEEDVKRFISLFLAQTAKAKKDRIGRNDSGRLSVFNVAKSVRVTSVSDTHPFGITFALTFENMVNVLRGQFEIHPEVRQRKPSNWPFEGNGSVLELLDVNWDEVPSPKDISAQLPNHLSPRLSHIVMLNNGKLKDRKLVESPLEFSRDIPALGGQCEAYLYIPERQSTLERGTGVRIGGYNPIASLEDFIKRLPTELRRRIPDILIGGTVLGDILIPKANDYRAHDSRSFRPEMFGKTGISLQIAQFLIDDLGPEVQRQYALHEEREARQRNEAVLTGLKEEVNAAFNYNRKDVQGTDEKPPVKSGGQGGSAPFWVTPSNVSLLVDGSEQLFSVARTLGSSGKYTWDGSQSGGALVVGADSREAVYTPGDKPGRKTLVVTDAKDPAKRVVININLLEEAPGLALSPAQVELPRGGKVRVHIKDPNLLEWDAYSWSLVDQPHGVQLKVAKNGMSAIVTAPHTSPLDAFAVQVQVKKKAAVKASSTIQIVEVPPDEDPIKIGDQYYTLALTTAKQPTLIHLKPDVNFDTSGKRKGKVGRISVYLEHESMQAAKMLPGGKDHRLVLVDAIIQAHTCHMVQAGGLDIAQAHGEFDKLRTEVLAAFAGRKGKK